METYKENKKGYVVPAQNGHAGSVLSYKDQSTRASGMTLANATTRLPYNVKHLQRNLTSAFKS